MVAEEALRLDFEEGAVIDAEMRVVIKRVRVETQVKRVGFEKVMIDQRNQGIKHRGQHHNRHESPLAPSRLIERGFEYFPVTRHNKRQN